LRVHLARRRRRLVKQIADDAFLHKAAVAHELPFSTSRSTDAPNVLPPELSAYVVCPAGCRSFYICFHLLRNILPAGYVKNSTIADR
jgi:hypothetical protein